MKPLSLEEASKLVSELTLLDAQMDSLISEMDKTQRQIESNKNEIAKRQNLEQTNIGLEVKIKQIREQFHARKAEQETRIRTLTEANWSIPVPKKDIAKGRVNL